MNETKYPYKLKASVILKDNKIMEWKVAKEALSVRYDTSNIPDNYAYNEIPFTVTSLEENEEVFNVKAVKWFKQWELHEDFRGGSPHEPTIFSRKSV